MTGMTPLLQAALGGAAGGLALMIGSLVAWHWKLPKKVVAVVMAFGAGVLISALALDLVEEATGRGGVGWTAGGFIAGAGLYVVANWLLGRVPRRGARSSASTGGGSGGGSGGTSIAIGALIDGIPESVVLGISVLAGGLSPSMMAAVFISNVPEGLSSTADLKQEGRSAGYVLGVWGAIAAVCTLSSVLGYALLTGAPGPLVAVINAVAAGGILAMLADTMIPEAYEEQHLLTGFITALGFLTAYVIGQLGGV